MSYLCNALLLHWCVLTTKCQSFLGRYSYYIYYLEVFIRICCMLAAVNGAYKIMLLLWFACDYRQSYLLLVAVATQLDKNLQGRLMWNAGLHSSINTMAIWDTEKHHLTWAIQVSMLVSVGSPSKTRQSLTSVGAERLGWSVCSNIG